MAWVNLLDVIYPIGSIYITVLNGDAANPANIIGGTWTALYNTTVLRNWVEGNAVDGQAALGEYAGSNFITEEQLPAHKHSASGTVNGFIQKYDADSTRLYGGTSGYFRYAGVQNAPVTVTVQNAGGARGFWDTTPLSACGNALLNLGRRW